MTTPQTDSTVQVETEQRIEEIRERLADITPGPWAVEADGACVWHLGSGGTICEVNFDHQTGDHQPGEDQAFIANAPSDIAFLLEQLASIPAQIEAAVQAEREKWEKVRNAGALLSNVAYNLSQQAGSVITEHDAELSRQCSDQWDAAIRVRGEAK